MRPIDGDGRPVNLDIVAEGKGAAAIPPTVRQFIEGDCHRKGADDTKNESESSNHSEIVLISDRYRKEQEALHAKGNYGTASLQFGEVVSGLANKLNCLSILDYGCGSMQNLLTVLRPDHEVRYQGYDPAVEEFSSEPEPADLVCCIDVLEHIEPELLENVLDHLQSLSPKWSFMTVHTGPARKTLSDGRNAHLIQQPPVWWLPKFFSRWDVRQFQAMPQGFSVLCRSLPLPN